MSWNGHLPVLFQRRENPRIRVHGCTREARAWNGPERQISSPEWAAAGRGSHFDDKNKPGGKLSFAKRPAHAGASRDVGEGNFGRSLALPGDFFAMPPSSNFANVQCRNVTDKFTVFLFETLEMFHQDPTNQTILIIFRFTLNSRQHFTYTMSQCLYFVSFWDRLGNFDY